jgi:hypothetical protein
MPQRLREIVGLILLLAAMDQLYRWLHPEVNLVRASLVGATAWVSLWLLAHAGLRFVPAWRGALVVFASAFASVLLIQSDWLVSRSPASVLVHAALVAVGVLVAGALPRASAPTA